MTAIELSIQGLGGPLCSIKGERYWTLQQLKVAIEAATNIPTYEQRLLFGTTDLGFAPGGKLGSWLPRKVPEADLTLVRLQSAQAAWHRKLDEQPWQLCFAPPEVKADRDVVLAVVQQNGCAIEYADASLQADRLVVMAAVQQNGMALEHVAPAMQEDAGVVLAAWRQTKFSQQLVQYIPPDLWSDRDFVGMVAKENELGLRLASTELRGDRKLVIDVVQKCGLSLRAAQVELRGDREVVLAALRRTGLALKHAAPELQADREIVLAAVQQDGAALQFASEDMQADRGIVLAAIKQRPIARHYASSVLQMDPEVLKYSLFGNFSKAKWASKVDIPVFGPAN